IPELEVCFLELLFHFMQLLEFVLETRAPFLTFNLENLFQHLLEGERAEFKTLQLPVFARGLVYMCQKERRSVLSYYTFIYASVVCKCMLRSAELQAILYDQQLLDLLTVDHANPTAT